MLKGLCGNLFHNPNHKVFSYLLLQGLVQSIEESLWTNQYEPIVMRIMRNETTF